MNTIDYGKFFDEAWELGKPIWKEAQEIAAKHIVENQHAEGEEREKVSIKALEMAADHLNEQFTKRMDEAEKPFDKLLWKLARGLFFQKWKEIMESGPEPQVEIGR